MEATVKQRLTDFIQSEGISVRNFERRCGLSSNYLRSLRHTPSEDKLSAILEAFPYLDRVWLLARVGEMYRPGFGPGGEVKTVKDVKPEKSYTVGQPYFNVDFLGGFDLTVNDQTANPDYLISFPPLNRPGVLWCNVSGHSMEPEISNGDIIALVELTAWRELLILGDIYALITTDGLRTVKRLRRGPDGQTFTLQPSNPDYDPQPIRADQIARVFKVLTAIKRF